MNREHDESEPPLGPSGGAGSDVTASRRWERWLLGAALALWLVYAWPAALGLRTFYVRDVFSNNFPQKAFGAEQLRQGRIPAFNPDWALGQPYRGNPSTLAFYPGNVLYLLLPFWSAFNLHFVLHWLLALFTMRRLARALGQARLAATLAGITYAGCGWTVSTLTFYNIVVVAAWWPLVMAFALEGKRRGIALGGVACGMALLGGEPITAFLGMVPLLLALVLHHGWKRALGLASAVGGLGLVVALPQIVATARIFGFSFRGAHGNFLQLVSIYSLQVPRLLELVLPLPFGWPSLRGSFGGWFAGIAQRIPFFMSLYFGAAGLALALAARRRAWQGLAVASLVLAIGSARFSGTLDAVSFGLFRFPEKFLFWFALAAPLLAGWGLERVMEEPPRWWRISASTAGSLALLLGILAWVSRPFVREQLSDLPAADQYVFDPAALASSQLLLWGIYLVVAGFVFLGCRWAAVHRRPALIVGLQLVTLTQLFPLLQTDHTSHYSRRTAWEDSVGEGAAVLNTSMVVPPWHDQPQYPEVLEGPRSIVQRELAKDLHPTPGALHGLSFPFAPDLEGMNSPFCTLLEINLARLDWPIRIRWFRVLGLDALVSYREPLEVEGLALEEEIVRLGEPSWLYRVKNPAPKVWWPRAIHPAANPREALRWVSFADDPVGEVAVPEVVPQSTEGRVQLVTETPDRIEIEVESGGGVLVLQRAYQPLFKARTDAGEALKTSPANLLLTAIQVPAGRHRVILAVDQWPEVLAAAAALLVATAALWLGRRRHP